LSDLDPLPYSYTFFTGVAISGDTLAVSTFNRTDAYSTLNIYTRSGSTWSLQQKLNNGGVDEKEYSYGYT